jgi:hypothetical protein
MASQIGQIGINGLVNISTYNPTRKELNAIKKFIESSMRSGVNVYYNLDSTVPKQRKLFKFIQYLKKQRDNLIRVDTFFNDVLILGYRALSLVNHENNNITAPFVVATHGMAVTITAKQPSNDICMIVADLVRSVADSVDDPDPVPKVVFEVPVHMTPEQNALFEELKELAYENHCSWGSCEMSFSENNV